MGGYLEGDEATPDNPAVQKSLNALLTPFVARKLKKESPHEVSVFPLFTRVIENNSLRFVRPWWL